MAFVHIPFLFVAAPLVGLFKNFRPMQTKVITATRVFKIEPMR